MRLQTCKSGIAPAFRTGAHVCACAPQGREDGVRVFARQIAGKEGLCGNLGRSIPADVQNDFGRTVGAVHQAEAAANEGRGIGISLAF